MPARDNRYSRFVALAKIALPLAALALLSSLFLFSRSINPDRAIPYAEVDVAELARNQGVSKPSYSAMTRDGAAISVTAESARPDSGGSGRANAEMLRARIDAPDGTRFDISSGEGIIDTAANQVELRSAASITSSDGLVIRSDRLTAATGRTEVVSPGPVEADGPFGTLRAGRMKLTRDSAQEAGYVVVFEGGVRLTYAPDR